MPINARSIARINANLTRIRQGRTNPILLVITNPDGSTTTRTVQAIFRPIQDADDTLDPQGHGQDFKDDDVTASFLMTDISLQQLRAVRYVDISNSGIQNPIATRFIITSIQPKGMIAGGNRFVCALRRQE